MKRKRSSTSPEPSSSWRVQALEATLIYDQPETASALEGRGLIQWDGGLPEKVWVDRFDARLLLGSLPIFTEPPPIDCLDEGWDDLPSDSEDTFFFNPTETEDYRREKKRRMISRDREKRLDALRAEGDEEQESWLSDEEPDEKQKHLMIRTATHICDSPNSTQLEFRILANHGGDPRFAFLRGRWKKAWARIKAQARQDKSVASLVGYGNSDDDDDELETVVDDAEEEKKQARRERAREWTRRRKAEITQPGQNG